MKNLTVITSIFGMFLFLFSCEKAMIKSAGETGPIDPSSMASVIIKVDRSFIGAKIWFTTTQADADKISSTGVQAELFVSSVDGELEMENQRNPFPDTIQVSTESKSVSISRMSDIIGYPSGRAIMITKVHASGKLRIDVKNLSSTETIPSIEIRFIKALNPL